MLINNVVYLKEFLSWLIHQPLQMVYCGWGWMWKVHAKQVKQLDGKNYLIIDKNDPQFSSKLVISIRSFSKAVRNLRIAKPYFAPCIC